jgi:hypothetical protein
VITNIVLRYTSNWELLSQKKEWKNSKTNEMNIPNQWNITRKPKASCSKNLQDVGGSRITQRRRFVPKQND